MQMQQALLILANAAVVRKAFAFVARRAVTLTLLLVTALAGCGTLPVRPELRYSAAQPPSPESRLARIALASSPSAELSGFRLMPLGVFSLDARIELARRARHTLRHPVLPHS